MSREKELRAAIKKAGLLARDKLVFMLLLDLSDYGTAVIPDRFQPRSIDHIAKMAEISRRTIQRSAAHLESHGWIARTRDAAGRGYSTKYAFSIGETCSCTKPGRPRKGVKPDTLSEPKRVSGLHPKGCQVIHKAAGQHGNSAGGQRGERVEGQASCIACTTPARRGCRTCWAHARLELAS